MLFLISQNYKIEIIIYHTVVTTQTLDQLKKGERATVIKFREELLAKRLQEMGLYIGSMITIKAKAPLGNPIAIDLGDFALSIRKQEAEKIEVSTYANKE